MTNESRIYGSSILIFIFIIMLFSMGFLYNDIHILVLSLTTPSLFYIFLDDNFIIIWIILMAFDLCVAIVYLFKD